MAMNVKFYPLENATDLYMPTIQLCGTYLWISGILESRSCMNACSVYSLNAFPGMTLPARPARCFADALDIGATVKASIPVLGLYALSYHSKHR
jgi:hypothetical protein